MYQKHLLYLVGSAKSATRGSQSMAEKDIDIMIPPSLATNHSLQLSHLFKQVSLRTT